MSDLIFGYTWSEIKAAQQGAPLRKILPLEAKAATDDICYQSDLDLFKQHGKDGLVAMQYMGVIDRLQRAGII